MPFLWLNNHCVPFHSSSRDISAILIQITNTAKFTVEARMLTACIVMMPMSSVVGRLFA